MVILTPTAANLTQALEALNTFLDGGECSARTRMALETAVEEAFMNIVNHSGATMADFILERSGDTVTLRFADDGKPFDPLALAAPDTTLPATERSIGGLGVLMIRRMTDEKLYRFENGQNVLTLRKRLP